MNLDNGDSIWKKYIPNKEEILLVLKSFSKKERFIFIAISLLFIVSTLFFLNTVNGFLSVKVPSYGGELTEGIIGTPRFINPLLAISDADRDLTSLVYSGLMKKNPDGSISPDLAKSYDISPDGLSYVFVLKDNIYFQDGTPVTADDVEFTINRLKDPILKSPKRVSWEGVTVQKINDMTIKFTLKQKYFPFLENTTLGIIPKRLWKDLTPEQMGFSDFNTKGIGSGPYKITNVTKNSSGIPDYYELSSFADYALGKPFIDKIIIYFYPNQTELVNAFDNGIVKNASSIDAKQASLLKESGYRILKTPLPRIFATFFNQSQNQIFADRNVRQALSLAVDKNRIINQVLYGYGTEIDTPIPGLSYSAEKYVQGDRYEEARKLLENSGWTYSTTTGLMTKKSKKTPIVELKFSLATGDVEELKETAKLIKEDWEKIGAQVDLKIFDIGDLNQNVIRPRKYDALFFGEIVGFDSDPFPFWHSSQRNDPGLNIAMYTNSKADKILEELRSTLSSEDRKIKYADFEREVGNDVPSVFTYSPDFIYMVDENLSGINLGNVTIPSDRFLGIKDWYLKTDEVWKPLRKFVTR